MPTAESTPVTQALDALGIPYRLFCHPGPLHSLEQAARERGQRPQQVVRSILFRLPGETFVMVLVAGPGQLSWPALRQHLCTTRMSMASEAEVLAMTGYPLGAVAPLGLPHPLRLLADQAVLNEEELSLGSGVRGVAVILKAADLRQALAGVELGAFTA